MESKTYTLPENSFLKQAARGMWIDSEFIDHGTTMKIKEIGKAYRLGKERLIDIKAIPVAAS